MSPMKSTRSVLLLSLALVATVTLAACSVAAARADSLPTGGGSSSEPGQGGDDPITSPPVDLPLVPTEPGATPVEPVPGVVNATPHVWDHIDVAADGRTITVYYWGGVDSCYGLDRVDVTVDDDGLLHVTVLEGRLGNLGDDVACIEIAMLKAVTITLDQPLIAPAKKARSSVKRSSVNRGGHSPTRLANGREALVALGRSWRSVGLALLRVRVAQVNGLDLLLAARPGADVERLDEDAEAHRKVDVLARNLYVERLGDERGPDQQQEAQRKHLQ